MLCRILRMKHLNRLSAQLHRGNGPGLKPEDPLPDFPRAPVPVDRAHFLAQTGDIAGLLVILRTPRRLTAFTISQRAGKQLRPKDLQTVIEFPGSLRLSDLGLRFINKIRRS